MFNLNDERRQLEATNVTAFNFFTDAYDVSEITFLFWLFLQIRVGKSEGTFSKILLIPENSCLNEFAIVDLLDK